MYWYLNTTSETALIFSSLMAITKEVRIPYDTLTYHFVRHKRTEYKKGDHWIVKTSVISSKRA
jgi:hypothetical protein